MKHLAIIFVFLFLVLVLAACQRTSLTEVGATETTRPLATPYAQEPAAGICAEAEGFLVSVYLRPDVPDPRCVRVKPDQHLSVKNETDQTLRVNIAHFQAELDPGEEVTFDMPFGEYLAPGVHRLTTSAPPGGPEIWLVEEQPSSQNLLSVKPRSYFRMNLGLSTRPYSLSRWGRAG